MAGKILVLGATGTVGRELVGELARRNESVRAATRSVGKHPERTGVEYVRLDLTDGSTFRPALQGVDRLFLMTPPGHAAADRLLAPFLDAALAQTRRVVTMTASGVETSDEIPMRKVERMVERAGAAWTHLRPTWFMQNFHTIWMGSIQATGNVAVPAGEARTAFVDARDVADCAAVALTQDGHAGKAYTITGAEAFTYAEAAAVLTRETGRRIGYLPVDDESFRSTLLKLGLPADYSDVMVSLFQNVRAGHAARISGDVKAVLGTSPRTLADYARTYQDAFATKRQLR